MFTVIFFFFDTLIERISIIHTGTNMFIKIKRIGIVTKYRYT